MKATLSTFAVFGIALTLSPALSAQQQARIELNDGSTLRGDLISLDNGHYRIKTHHLGIIELNASDVSSLSIGDAAAVTNPAVPPPAGPSAQLQGLQRGLMSDQTSMNMIMKLADDPAIQAILNNPDLMRAVSNGDIATLSRTPEFTRLLNNPKIRAIQQQTGNTTAP